MAMRIEAAERPKPSAAANSKVTPLAAIYGRAYTQYHELHEAMGPTGPLDIARRSMFRGLGELAVAIMNTPPTGLADLALQLGLAASWCNLVATSLPENSFERTLGLGIDSAVQNATRFLCEAQEDLTILGVGEAAACDLLNELYREAVRCGAEIEVAA